MEQRFRYLFCRRLLQQENYFYSIVGDAVRELNVKIRKAQPIRIIPRFESRHRILHQWCTYRISGFHIEELTHCQGLSFFYTIPTMSRHLKTYINDDRIGTLVRWRRDATEFYLCMLGDLAEETDAKVDFEVRFKKSLARLILKWVFVKVRIGVRIKNYLNQVVVPELVTPPYGKWCREALSRLNAVATTKTQK